MKSAIRPSGCRRRFALAKPLANLADAPSGWAQRLTLRPSAAPDFRLFAASPGPVPTDHNSAGTVNPMVPTSSASCIPVGARATVENHRVPGRLAGIQPAHTHLIVTLRSDFSTGYWEPALWAIAKEAVELRKCRPTSLRLPSSLPRARCKTDRRYCEKRLTPIYWKRLPGDAVEKDTYLPLPSHFGRFRKRAAGPWELSPPFG
jgi:hypothetical protein